MNVNCRICGEAIVCLRKSKKFCAKCSLSRKRECACRYIHRNKGRLLAKTREYRKSHPEWAAWTQKVNRARRRGSEGYFSFKEWKDKLNAFGGRCAYCYENSATEIDHLIPISKGGKTIIDNILPSCRSCNARKGVSLSFQWPSLATRWFPPDGARDTST